jgi:hypothetical protein
MRLKPIAKNQNEMVFKNGSYTITVFFSYETPVAVHINKDMDRILVTEKKYSSTTSRHINSFCGRYAGEVINVSQGSINNVLNFYK